MSSLLRTMKRQAIREFEADDRWRQATHRPRLPEPWTLRNGKPKRKSDRARRAEVAAQNGG